MKNLKAQRGMSPVTLILILALAGFLGITGLKLLPFYLDSMKIDKAMAGLIEAGGLGSKSKREIQDMLIKRMDIDAVDAVTYKNYKELIKVTKNKDKVTVSIVYTSETPLAGNLTILADFDKFVEN
ncbi:MAG: hypothetical protein DRQ37_07020 [Gammaproteobacteria bacterium]|nr:MAG: hypothetical protein DRQ37_07020 [Gammaproteobacteria bacterium]